MLLADSMLFAGKSDAELVGDVAGDRNAFAEIVTRYQRLICSLAYSATGDVARSEDIAQETFVAAWRHLPELREAAKLRSWLCGIARHRIQEAVRTRYREPTYGAEPVEELHVAAAPEAHPAEHAVSEDEAAIVWRALERIPEGYREPLILFHRENQSIARVAELLEISEDNVKQRLVRGRKLLQAEVEAVVNGALRRTAPSNAFTSGVMAALPLAGGATKVAIGTAGGSALAKGLGAAGGAALGAPALPLLSLWSEWRRMRGYEAEAATTEEREVLGAHRRVMLATFAAVAAVLIFWMPWMKRHNPSSEYAPLVGPGILVLALGMGGLRVVLTRQQLAQVWRPAGRTSVKRSFEYRSAWAPLGRPCLHVRLGYDPRWIEPDRPVKAWLAVGHVAHGWLMAFGAVAIAPISFGGFAVGLISVGAFAVGGFAAGAMLGVGGYAFGAVAIGWLAAGRIALAANGAYALHAYAREFALCPPQALHVSAHAPHANDDVASALVRDDGFLRRVSRTLATGPRAALLALACALPLVVWEVAWEIMKGRPWPSLRPKL